eukprot:8715712-Pyramimonas_sp.AAC.1
MHIVAHDRMHRPPPAPSGCGAVRGGRAGRDRIAEFQVGRAGAGVGHVDVAAQRGHLGGRGRAPQQRSL